MTYSQVAKNAKLGDGCVVKGASNVNACIKFISTDLSYLLLKRDKCEKEGFSTGQIGTQKSGYGGAKTIYKFDTHVDPRITEVYEANLSDLIISLDKEDLILWYLDDGSWHKTRHTMHLYSNMLDDKETQLLIKQIARLYEVEPRPRKDRKQDGREFNYLYFPRDLVRLFRPDVEEYIERNNLGTMYYKVGGTSYEDKPQAKPLTDDEVRSIRSLYEGKRGDIQRISQSLGLSRSKIRGVVSNRTYKHVI